MTLREAIARADAVKPNAFDTETKAQWLKELDGSIAVTVMLLPPLELSMLRYDNMDCALLVDAPFDDLYPLYLAAKIDQANGEYNKYANSMEIYNARYQAFCAWFIAQYQPGQGYRRSGKAEYV